MNATARTHPVFLSHTQDLEQMLYFLADLQHRLEVRGKNHGEKFDFLLKVRRRCQDILLQMYAEDEPYITLMNDSDYHWTKLFVDFLHREVLKDQRQTG